MAISSLYLFLAINLWYLGVLYMCLCVSVCLLFLLSLWVGLKLELLARASESNGARFLYHFSHFNSNTGNKETKITTVIINYFIDTIFHSPFTLFSDISKVPAPLLGWWAVFVKRIRIHRRSSCFCLHRDVTISCDDSANH